VHGNVGGTNNNSKNNQNFLDNLPDSIAESSKVQSSSYEESKESYESESLHSAGHMARPNKKKAVECRHDKEDERISTNMLSLVKIVLLNKEKLLLFSEAQNFFMSLKAKKLANLEFFSPLSPTDAVLSFPPCPGVFENNYLVVYKEGKVILVDLLQSAERQKLHMISQRVRFTHMESQSIADSVTERSDAGGRKFIIFLDKTEFALVYEQAVKIFVISDFGIKWVQEYDELIEDNISYISYYHTGKKRTHLAIGTESSSQICLYNIKTNVLDKTLDFGEESITSVFEIGSKYIAATTLTGYFAVWDKNTHIQILKDNVLEAIFVVFKIPDTDLFAIGGDGPLLIYDTLDKIAEVQLKKMKGGIIDIEYNQTTSTLICGDTEGTLYTYCP